MLKLITSAFKSGKEKIQGTTNLVTYDLEKQFDTVVVKQGVSEVLHNIHYKKLKNLLWNHLDLFEIKGKDRRLKIFNRAVKYLYVRIENTEEINSDLHVYKYTLTYDFLSAYACMYALIVNYKKENSEAFL